MADDETSTSPQTPADTPRAGGEADAPRGSADSGAVEDAGYEVALGPSHVATSGGGEGFGGDRAAHGLSDVAGADVVRGPAHEATDGELP